MNNILLNNSYSSYYFTDSKVIINVKGKSRAKIKKIPKDFNLEINIASDASLIIDLELLLDNNNFNIIINNKYNSAIDFNMAIKYKNNNNVNLINNINESNTKSDILIRCVEDSGLLNIKAEGRVSENTFNNYYKEDIKAIVENNNSIVIKPNLCVSSCVSAFHNMAISNINYDELFYLESIGINKNKAIDLIKEGFLKGILKIREGGF